MSIKRDIVTKENAVQAILVADTFQDEFAPISNDIPLSLIPVVNKPLIDYTLEFLSLGGIEETFLFCCNHISDIKKHINKSVEEAVGWTLTMKVHTIVSESCGSFGDCLRDLDAKGLLRDDFVLIEPGTVSNISLLPLLKKHSETCQHDRGAALTLVYQECGLGHKSLCPVDETLLAVGAKNRVLFHSKTHKSSGKRVDFPLEIFLENPSVSIHHNIKDTGIAICSSAVLPLFTDNFDFQTKDDFVRGLLMNEEIMGSTVYCAILKGTNYGGAVHNWRTYQAISMDLKNDWIYPIIPPTKRLIADDSIVSTHTSLVDSSLTRSILGPQVAIGKNVQISDSFIFANTKIEDNVTISLSIIGPDCVIKKGAKVTAGSIIGKGVVIQEELFVENSLVQRAKPEDELYKSEDQIGNFAYRLRLDENEDDIRLDKYLAKKMSRLHIYDEITESDYETDYSGTDTDDVLSHTQSPPPDDTKLFFTEVIDSLSRGFDDKLLCDNLILEINSSRYAYNVTVKEVNFNVIKAILMLSDNISESVQYFQKFAQMLNYFSPVFKNYIRTNDAMLDCLQAIEDVAATNTKSKEKWIIFILKYFYEKDYLGEEAILEWFSKIEDAVLYRQVKPFANWLQEAEEEDSSEEDEE